MKLVIELAENDTFKRVAPVSDKQLKERGREELVTRFFAYGDGLEDYADELGYPLNTFSKFKSCRSGGVCPRPLFQKKLHIQRGSKAPGYRSNAAEMSRLLHESHRYLCADAKRQHANNPVN